MSQEDKLLKEWCKRDDVDYRVAKSLKEKIFPLLENAHNKKGNTFDRVLCEQREGTNLRLFNSARLIKILQKDLNPKHFSTEEISALSAHLEFIVLVEGFFAAQVNFLIFTLTANGHDFYSTRKGKYVKDLDDIEEADLATKMKFLKEHDFNEVVKYERRIRKLRNSVAHVFYEIESNGNLKIGKETVTRKEYAKFYDYLRNVSFAIQLIHTLYSTKSMSSLSPQEWWRIQNLTLEKVKCSCGYVNLVPTDQRGFQHNLNCTKCKRPLSKQRCDH